MTKKTSPSAFRAETVAIVGVGLLGGSIAAAIKARRLVRNVVGVGRNAQRLVRAQQAGLIDAFATDVTEAGRQADFVVVCTPVDRVVDDVRLAVADCPDGLLVTDVGSVKGSICGRLKDLSGPRTAFVGSHPLAGSEKSGFEHASLDLLDRAVCIVTPTETAGVASVRRVCDFWTALGMAVVQLTPQEHDCIVAQTSHVPHVVAAALALLPAAEHGQFVASGFTSTTRVAAGDPDLWRAILAQNSDAVVEYLDQFASRLAEFRAALAQQNEDELRKLLTTAKERCAWLTHAGTHRPG